jgi:hypothetical protein
MKRYLLLFLPVFAASCIQQRPIVKEQSNNNKDYKVSYLFEYEGCKVYRFYDRGNEVYFTNCRGEAITKTDSTEVRNSINLRNH